MQKLRRVLSEKEKSDPCFSCHMVRFGAGLPHSLEKSLVSSYLDKRTAADKADAGFEKELRVSVQQEPCITSKLR